jgi:hypothetical protein
MFGIDLVVFDLFDFQRIKLDFCVCFDECVI